MRKRRVVLVLVVLAACAAAAIAFLIAQDDAKTAAWKDAFALEVALLEERGRPTTYDDLNAALTPVAEASNAASEILQLGKIYDELRAPWSKASFHPGVDLLTGDSLEAEDKQAAEATLRDQGELIEQAWQLLEQATEKPVLQGRYTPRDAEASARLTWALPGVTALLVLRAYANPDRRLDIALRGLTLADRMASHNGYYHYRRADIVETSLVILRVALEGGLQPTAAQHRELRRILSAWDTNVLADFRELLDYSRVYWIRNADHTLEQWPWISDYDHFGENWKLYRDLLRAIGRLEQLEQTLDTEEGLRAFATQDVDLVRWNQIPSLGHVAGKDLALLSQVRIARIALELLEVLQLEHPELTGEALAARVMASPPPEALTGEPYQIRVRSGKVYISVPWREADFPLRPYRARAPWSADYGEPPHTIANDPLREDGYIWAIALP